MGGSTYADLQKFFGQQLAQSPRSLLEPLPEELRPSED